MGIFQHGIRWVLVAGAIGGFGLAGGCSDDSSSGTAGSTVASNTATSSTPSAQTPPAASKPAEPEVAVVDMRTPEERVEAGRSVYLANCIACHNMDPKQDGALGPATAGSSLALLEARIVRGDYPEGYTPKRTSRVMVPLPHLKPQLPELAAYLGSLE